jgi:membrane protease YdiL (CAAX protease family)
MPLMGIAEFIIGSLIGTLPHPRIFWRHPEEDCDPPSKPQTWSHAMSVFQIYLMALIALWLLAVAVRFRRSTLVLAGGLIAVGLVTFAAVMAGSVSPYQLGLGPQTSIPSMLGFALAGLAAMYAYSPVADRLATRWVAKPPTLEAFRALQQSRLKLLVGIIIAWIFGGFLEELTFRGIVLPSTQALASDWLPQPAAAGVAISAAAAGAGVIHLYQGPRAVIIIVQLSALFGVLFVVSGYNLWAVILCHGLYDTIAFVRFAAGKSKYSRLDDDHSGDEAGQPAS